MAGEDPPPPPDGADADADAPCPLCGGAGVTPARVALARRGGDALARDALRGEVERREAAARALAARLRACQARLLHLGFPSPPPPHPQTSSLPSSPTAADSVRRGLFHPFLSDDDEDEGDDGYRSVQCLDYHPAAPADVGTPRTHHLLNRTPSPDADPKGVVLSGSPRHARTLSGDSIPRIALADEFPLFDHRDAPDGDDEDGDRVYTVDAVHGVPVDWGSEVGVPAAGAGGWAEEGEEIQKLKARLQALEADRESMRHAIMSMGDEKAQVVLLREIAQQLCRDATPFPAVPLKVQPRLQPVVMAQRKVVKKQTSFVKIFIMTVIKWVASIFCWRRKSNRIRYPIGMCGSNVGLMLVLDRFPKQRQKKIPKRKLSASTL
ncbi:myosin-binding protein 7 [Panicum miliaceum]|uniref:Myosin-binding protein 7 n=1 Tax=Panicum miliaceum TaxID=4540 RepID=A0A3L6PJL8_PANMI|nr:myosin-binding protein 7 [Panicum miliaceum]